MTRFPTLRFFHKAGPGLKSIAAVWLLGLTALIAGCGWGSSSNGISEIGSSLPPTSQLTSIAIAPLDVSLPAGLTRQYTATGLYSDGSKQDISSTVTWSSTQPGIASITNATGSAGLATTVSAGATTITATFGGVSGTTTLTVTTATLVSISVTPTTPSIAKGTFEAFTASGVYNDGSVQNISASVAWNSSNAAVASISNTPGTMGRAYAAVPGSTTITATLTGISGSTTLTVTPATLMSIAVMPTNPSIASGTTQQFSATGTYTDGSFQTLTTSATWSSGTTSVATINNAGLASALAAGPTVITATVGGISGSTTLTVTSAALVSIAVTPANLSIAKGVTQAFIATGTYADGSTQILTASAIWTSSVPTVATITTAPPPQGSGVATAVAVGNTVITATLGTVSGSTTLTVNAATLVSIAVTPANSSLGVGASEQFTATATYTDGSTQNLTTTATWTSSNTTAATISSATGPQAPGVAKAVAIGSTSITAAFGGITSPAATLTVTAATLKSITVLPPNRTIGVGYTQPYIALGTYTDGSTQNLTTSVTWNSNPITVATISSAAGPQAPGVAQAVGVGTTSITATSVTAASGTVTSPAVTLTVTAASEYAYATNYGTYGPTPSTTVSQYTIGLNGVLTAMTPATVTAGLGPFSVAVSSSGQYAYVASYQASTVSQYMIGAPGTAAPGSLTGLTPTTVPAVTPGSGSQSIAIDPTGRFAYTANNNAGTVSQYAIGVNGTLSPIAPDVAAGTYAASVSVDPTGPYVYVANYGANSISEYSIAGNGALASIATIPTGANPNSIVVDPTGRYVYVANEGTTGAQGTTVSQYTIGVGGVLTAMTPPTAVTGPGPAAVTVDPSGRYAYVANYGHGSGTTVSQYTIGPSGALTPLSAPTVTVAPGSSGPTGVSVDPTDTYVYVADRTSGDISQFTVGTDGSLTLIGTVAVPAGVAVSSVVAAY